MSIRIHARPWHKKIRGIQWIVSLDGSGGYDFRIPQNCIPQNRIVSLESYRIPQIVSLGRIPKIELYRGIQLRDTIEGYDTILRDTIRFEGYDLRDTIKSYLSIFARDTMRDTIVSYPSLCQGLPCTKN
jgi:hypothetical protein